MKLVEILGKLSLQIYDLKQELNDIKTLLNPPPPKTLPTLNLAKLKKLAVEEAIRTEGDPAKAAKLVGVSERTIYRIMSGEEQ